MAAAETVGFHILGFHLAVAAVTDQAGVVPDPLQRFVDAPKDAAAHQRLAADKTATLLFFTELIFLFQKSLNVRFHSGVGLVQLGSFGAAYVQTVDADDGLLLALVAVSMGSNRVAR